MNAGNSAGPDRKTVAGAFAALVLLTLAVFLPARHFDFVEFDDPAYVTANPHVQAGLAWDGVVWAFTTAHAANWHPLTWISLMMDQSLFGTGPYGHHLVNVLLHALAAGLLFVALAQLTGLPARSWAVAAIFALHPLRVESVAWVSERKDVLSAVFFAACLWAYASHVRRQSRRSKHLTLLFLVLGLMSKPMLVTVPFLLLLIDAWPLGRVSARPSDIGTWRNLAVEKMPLFVVCLVCAVVTFLVQAKGGAVSTTTNLPMGERLANAAVSCIRYLGLIFWPASLSVFYPLRSWHFWQVLMSGLVVTGISLAVFRQLDRRPWLAVGWFWFLGMLVPVAGIVQVGTQSMADRYTYLPGIGIILPVVWGAAEWTSRRPSALLLQRGLTMATLAVLACATTLHLPTWQNSLALFKQASESDPQNVLALLNTGHALDRLGRNEEAAAFYQRAIEMDPAQEEAQFNLATWHLQTGNCIEAEKHVRNAISLNPDRFNSYGVLATIKAREGRDEEAIPLFLKALELKPDFLEAHYNLGTLFLNQGDPERAITHFKAAQASPAHPPGTETGLGLAFFQIGKFDQAEKIYRSLLARMPGQPDALKGLASVLSATDRNPEARSVLEQVIQRNPDDAGARIRFASLLIKGRDYEGALSHLDRVLKSSPNHPMALERKAWVLSTAQDAASRNGQGALQLAVRAVELTRGSMAEPLMTLAAAQAESGNMAEAIRSATQAQGLAANSSQPQLTKQIQAQLESYRAGKAWRDPAQ